MDQIKGKRLRSFELWRRIFLLLGLALAIWLWAYASPAPLVHVEWTDVEKMQERELKGSVVTEQNRFRAAMEPFLYLELIADHNLAFEDKAVHQSFLDKLYQVSQRNVPAQWSDRVQPESLRFGLTPRTYFRAEEEPVYSWLLQWPDRNRPFYVVFESQDDQDLTVAHLSYLARPLEDISIGGSSLIRPPDSFVRLSLIWPLLSMLGGLLLYLLLPRDRSRSAGLVYPRWKTYLADLAMVIIFGMFFAMPLLVAGNSLLAIDSWLPLTLIFWLLAGLSFWLASINAWSASFSLNISSDGLEMTSYRGRLALPFKTIQSVAPIEKKAPRWMQILLVLSVLFSAGSMRFVSASQLLTTSGTLMRGLRFYKNDDSLIDLWVNERGGLEIASREDELIEAMAQAGLQLQEEGITDRTLAQMPGGNKIWPRRPLVVPLLAMTVALIVMVATSSIVGASQTAGAPAALPDTAIRDAQSAELALGQDAELEWGNFTVSVLQPHWTRIYGGEGVERIDALAWQQEGLIWAAGLSTTDQGVRSPGYMLLVDAKGDAKSERFYPLSGKDVFLADLAVAGDNSLFITGTAGTYHGRDAFLAAVDEQGETLWHIDLETSENSGGSALLYTSDGHLYWSGSIGGEAFLRLIDAQGHERFNVSPVPDAADSSISDLLPAPGGVWGVGSVIQEPEGLSGPFVALFDEQGNMNIQATWASSHEGQINLFAGTLRDETLVLTGTSRLGNSYYRELHLVNLDSDGALIWEHSLGLPGHHVTGTAAAAHPDGDLLILGNVNTDDVAHLWSFLLRADQDGSAVSFHRLWAGSNLRASDILVDSDGNIVIGGTTERLQGRGSASIALFGLRLEHLESQASRE